MASKSLTSISNKKKTEPSYSRFSDYKVNSVSTAQRHTVSPSSDSQISQFQMTGRNPEILIQQKVSNNNSKKVQLTFAAVKYKRNLQIRLKTFISAISSMIAHVDESKCRRKVEIHNKLLPNHTTKQKSRLTFQMIGTYIKKDKFYQELCIQEHRLKQVEDEIIQLQQISSNLYGGLGQEQIIDLMNTINRIQEYCEYLCQVIDQLQVEFENQA